MVFLSNREPEFNQFVLSFLTKYEDVKVYDYLNSSKGKKRLKTIKEKRELFVSFKEGVIFSRGLLDLIPQGYYVLEDISKGDALKVPELSLDEIKKTLSVFELRDDQAVAVAKCLGVKRGVIQMPTATGKSAIITSVLKRLHEVNPDMHSLVIAPTLSTVENIQNSFKANNLDSSIYGHPDKEIVSPITVSLVQSLVGTDITLDNINAVVYDECLSGHSRILMPDGSEKYLADVYGDDSIKQVLTFNLETKQYEVKDIVRKIRTEYDDRFWRVYAEDLTGKHKRIGVSVTPNHKIYIKDKGYIRADEIEIGDLVKVDVSNIRYSDIFESTTYAQVIRISPNIGKFAKYKYNLEVADNHNYFADKILVSNCHHLKCDTWNQLNMMLPNVEYALGFSALSIDKSDIYKNDIRFIDYDSALIIGSSGKVIMHMDADYYIKNKIIATPIIFRVKHDELFLPEGADESDWQLSVKKGLMSEDRTDKIAKITSIFTENNRKVLILVSEKDFAFKICSKLADYGVTDFGISFGSGQGYLFSGFYPPKDDKSEIKFKTENSLKVIEKLGKGDVKVLIT